ncbi:hypothetical protein FEM48_Zijuj11G0096800 [Ziziphus jujuba var. spinosa]|uniref:Delta-1-pyrroline-5-carboxylate synthase n=1 Tax=Ziziphus jujuba var. spinosa TaxID=714518 RepID=A0A978UI77_ZIZJJ|nr:hypothetical protein FEM48_Zijuj11G0096800 [Ziziphus jujuba var. spinosa]
MDPTRAFVNKVKRLVVGTAVVTRPDGRIALGRLGALCEQEFIRCICSFSDLRSPNPEFDGKACAAVGQSSLMALYDAMFSQLDITSSQLLVTDAFFGNEAFRQQLSDTVNSLLGQRVIPIFNENDADSSGIFWDNDSLAGLLAYEQKADLLVLLSDVEGLYSGPPSDPKSKLIDTYVKEKHQGEITFGDKSRVGRGGMTAKVEAAVYAADRGTPVVITSGYATDNIIRVLQGERIGTVFHKDAHMWTVVKEVSAREMAVAARECSRRLQALESKKRRQILLNIADALEANESAIRAENEADISAAQEGGYDKPLLSRLALKPGKASTTNNLDIIFLFVLLGFDFCIHGCIFMTSNQKISSLARSVRKLADMEEPIGHVLKRTELADGLTLKKVSCPLGVLLVVFESRPDALVQIAALAIRSGNGLLLKGGKEAKRSNAILHKLITSAIPDSVGKKLIGLVTSREDIPDLLKLDDVIDLVIPRGSNKLVSQIKESTKIPVLGHADGICHVYVDKSAKMDMAKRVVLDAKTDYPAACNAMETLLVHKDLTHHEGFNELIRALRHKGVILYGGPRASTLLRIPEATSLHHEYNSLACTVEIVDDVFAAIDHIHEHGSAHTDCIVTEDEEIGETFLHQVDSAAVFHNASTRFCDGARFGLGAEVGISTSRIHARGPVGVEGLLTTRWILRGKGQVVDGDKGVNYTHKNLPVVDGDWMMVVHS